MGKQRSELTSFSFTDEISRDVRLESKTSDPPLCVVFGEQNGVPPPEPEVLDPVPRFIRNGRDLSKLVFADSINT